MIKKLQHEWMVLEGVLDDAALDTGAAAVNEPHVAQAGGVCFI